MKDPREFVEHELSNKKMKLFLLIYPHEAEIYVDTKALPQSAILCAMCDGISFLMAKVGSKKKQERSFIPIDWIIKEWGGPKDLVSAIERRKQILMDDMERMKTLVEKLTTTAPA